MSFTDVRSPAWPGHREQDRRQDETGKVWGRIVVFTFCPERK